MRNNDTNGNIVIANVAAIIVDTIASFTNTLQQFLILISFVEMARIRIVED